MMVIQIPSTSYWITRKLDDMTNQADRISWKARERYDAISLETARTQFVNMQTTATLAISRLTSDKSKDITAQILRNRFIEITTTFNRRYREAIV